MYIAAITLFILAVGITYFIYYRPWQLRWGATEVELKQSLPGDDIVDNPSFNATRVVTIEARSQDIYPWIVQMGIKRAGWYSYDLLDNLGKKSAMEILDEYQNIQIGDLIPMSPDGKNGIWVKDFEKNHWMLWWDKKGDTSWVWMINPIDNNTCRLITRVRVKYRWFSVSVIFNLIIEFFDMPMMRKCMIGIKQRAESLNR